MLLYMQIYYVVDIIDLYYCLNFLVVSDMTADSNLTFKTFLLP